MNEENLTPFEKGQSGNPNGGIYKISFANTNHIYIGSAVNFSKRKSNHLSGLRSEIHCNKFMQNVFNKYGDFIFEILERCDKSILIEREQYFIDLLNPDLNILKIANSSLGFKHDEKTIVKLKIIAIERATDNQWKRKVSKNWFKHGKRVLTDSERLAFIERGRVSFKGKKHSETSRLLMSEKARNRDMGKIDLTNFLSAGIEASKKKVIQKTLNGVVVGNFNSITEAIKQFNTKTSKHLSNCCKGLKKQYKGFIWEFYNEKTTTNG